MHIRDVYRSHFYGLKLYYVVFLHRVASLCRDFLFLYSLSWSHLRIVFWGGIQDSVALCISPPLSTKMCDVFFFFCLPSKRTLKVQYSPNGSVWHTASTVCRGTAPWWRHRSYAFSIKHYRRSLGCLFFLRSYTHSHHNCSSRERQWRRVPVKVKVLFLSLIDEHQSTKAILLAASNCLDFTSLADCAGEFPRGLRENPQFIRATKVLEWTLRLLPERPLRRAHLIKLPTIPDVLLLLEKLIVNG